jgi:hypothetical protein
MGAREISVKKYVVRLSGEERERLETLIRKGKSPARRVLNARILLKAADLSDAQFEASLSGATRFVVIGRCIEQAHTAGPPD